MKTKHFCFATQSFCDSTTANVFIHGYSAGHNFSDRALLVSQIPQALNTEINLLAFWQSSHFTSVSTISRNVVLGATRLHPAAAVAAFAADRAVHFALARKRAGLVGEALLEELEAYLLEHYPCVTRVNLVGHSLGGRVVVSALRQLAKDRQGCKLIIGDVLLMAAAVEVSGDEAQTLKTTVASPTSARPGRLINAYSRSDSVLLMNVDETCLGRHEVAHFVNTEMAGFGHLDYWPRLHEVLLRTAFAGFKGQQLGVPLVRDPVLNDNLLYGLLQNVPVEVLEQGIKHLKTSSWTHFDDKQPLYSFVQEVQLLGGHCLANLVRGRGVEYAQLLDMLVEHFDLINDRQHCGAVVELEALLIRQVFDNAFPDGHAFSCSPISAVKAMAAETYFSQVDALAERLTLASYVNTPAAPLKAEAPQGMLVSSETLNLTQMNAWRLFSALPSLLGTRAVGRWVTNLKSALKPGYSALVPAVAVIFFARVHWGNEHGFKH